MYVTCTRSTLYTASEGEAGVSDLRKSLLWGTCGVLFHAVCGSVTFDASLCVVVIQFHLTKVKLKGKKYQICACPNKLTAVGAFLMYLRCVSQVFAACVIGQMDLNKRCLV